MKFYYPKFLKTGPNFVGLSIIDLVILVVSLVVALVFNLTSMESLGLVFAVIGVCKLVALKFPRGHIQFYTLKRSILDWRNDLSKLTQGVFI
ncbi:hypothetical protein DOM21_13230 [Bacteriovorax stolpii]|nr:hypothetical protein DOM21_13230 [Bacteriovorax stolpii]